MGKLLVGVISLCIANIYAEEATFVEEQVSIPRTQLRARISINGNLIDNFLQQYRNHRPTALGPNCFATAWSAVTGDVYRGHMLAEEFQTRLNSPLCQEQPPNQSLEKGDIVVIKNNSLRNSLPHSRIEHAFVHYESNQVLEKASYSSSTLPALVDVSEALKPYTTSNLDSIRTTKNHSNNKIGTWAVTYRCVSLESYLSSNFTQILAENRRFFNQIRNEEDRLRSWTQQKNTHTDALRAITQRLQSLQTRLTQVNMASTGLVELGSEIHPRDRTLTGLPPWVHYLLIHQTQSMIKQSQYLIADLLPRRDGSTNN